MVINVGHFPPKIYSVSNTTYITTIPVGWKWCWTPDASIIAVHPDHPPCEFNMKRKVWLEATTVDGETMFVEMDPQPEETS